MKPSPQGERIRTFPHGCLLYPATFPCRAPACGWVSSLTSLVPPSGRLRNSRPFAFGVGAPPLAVGLVRASSPCANNAGHPPSKLAGAGGPPPSVISEDRGTLAMRAKVAGHSRLWWDGVSECAYPAIPPWSAPRLVIRGKPFSNQHWTGAILSWYFSNLQRGRSKAGIKGQEGLMILETPPCRLVSQEMTDPWLHAER
jgi:hypothetical protein